MTAVAFDTLRAAQKLQDAGFTRKQAAGVVETMAEALADRPSKEAVVESVEALGRAVDKRFTKLEAGQAELKAGQAGIQTILAKIIDGQAVLLQNDMELRRRLDQRD
ncbi:hypothetical protein WCLP8_1430055 [uncultured Gammaproteobacteria bacterium]